MTVQFCCNKKVNDLHKTAIKYSNAKAQASIIHEMMEEFTEEEVRIYKRGRNQKSHTSPKNADIIDYKCATGFEALVGYLYLKEDKEFKTLGVLVDVDSYSSESSLKEFCDSITLVSNIADLKNSESDVNKSIFGAL